LRTSNGPSFCPERRTWARQVRLVLVVLITGHCILAEQAFGQELQSDHQPAVVRGTVINAVTKQPIGRALVYSADRRYAMLTDSEGHFEFTVPKVAADTASSFSYSGEPAQMWSTGAAGRLTWLLARKPGFLDDPNGRTQFDGTPGSEVAISLMPEALIKGRVTLPAAEPTNGIDLQLYSRQIQDGSPRWMLKNSVRTKSNGEFRFAELGPGSYKVLTREWMDNDRISAVPGAQLYGFPPLYYPSATDFATAATIHLTAGQTFQADLSLIRKPYYPVKIPVANADQNGGMNINVSLQGQRGPGYSLGYNREKQVVEGLLPNAKYLVEAESYGPNPASGSVNIDVAGAPVEGPVMAMVRTNSIPVNVKEEFSSKQPDTHAIWRTGNREFSLRGPRLDLQISAEAMEEFGQPRGGSMRQPAGPNDDSLVLENLAPGRYWLRLTAARGYVASATMGGTDLLREPLVVVPGASTPIDITLRDDYAELQGTLLVTPVTPPGSAHPTWAAYIDCIPVPDSPGQFLEVPASYDGKFDSQRVAPGAYRVIAFASQQQNLPYRDPEAMKFYETKGQIVHFASGQKVTLQLQSISSSE